MITVTVDKMTVANDSTNMTNKAILEPELVLDIKVKIMLMLLVFSL